MSINVDLDRPKKVCCKAKSCTFTRAAQKSFARFATLAAARPKKPETKAWGASAFERHSRHVETSLLSGRRFARLWSLEDPSRFRPDRFGGGASDRKGNEHLTVGYSPYVDLRFMTELKEMALGESPRQ